MPAIPDPGTAFRVLIERALNHEIGIDGLGNVDIVDPEDGIEHKTTVNAFVNARKALFSALGNNVSNAQTELQQPLTKKKGGLYAGIQGTSGNSNIEFTNIQIAMQRLGVAYLGDSLEVFYLAMRVFLEKVEHKVAVEAAKVAFMDGWDAARGRPGISPISNPNPRVSDTARDNAANVTYGPLFDINAKVQALVHSTY